MSRGRWRVWLRRGLGLALVAAAAAFIGLTIVRNWQQIQAVEWRVRIWELALSVLVLLGALAWGVYVWGRVLDRFAHPPIRLRTLLRIWFLSNLARYVPGKIWQFVGVAQLGRRAELPGTLLITSLALHAGLALVAAALVSLLALPTFIDDVGAAGAAALAFCVVAGLAVVHPAVLNRALGLLPDRLHLPVLAWSGRWRDGISLLSLSVVSWLIYGAAFALMADSLVGIPLALVPALIAANAFAFIVSYLVFVTPGGLGAREAALVILLEPLGSPAVAAVIAVAFRLWLIVAEVLGAGLAALPTRRTAPADAP